MKKEKKIIGGKGEMILVKNLMSASVMPAPEGYADRLDFWKEIAGVENPECAHEICHRPATHGAIASRAFSTDKTLYVFPACETCARRTEMLYVNGPLIALP